MVAPLCITRLRSKRLNTNECRLVDPLKLLLFGSLTRELKRRYWDEHQDPAWATPVPYTDSTPP